MTMPPVYLPAAVYDALEESIQTYGLGAGRYYRVSHDDHRMIPCCFIGHFETSAGGYLPCPISEAASDRAVAAINKRKRVYPGCRVGWTDFCIELNILRLDLAEQTIQSCDVSAHDSSVRSEYRLPSPVVQGVAGQPIQRR